MKRIIITGATGFVGAHMVRHFSIRGHEVIALGRRENPPAQLKKFATYIKADITSPLPTIEGDVCIHCAGLATDTATFHELFQVNVEGTKHVFKGIDTPVFIHISSASVYPLMRKNIEETDTFSKAKLSNYGKTKLLAEEFLKINHQQKQRVIILRPRAIYGTQDRVLLPRILKMMKKQAIIAPGDMRIRVSLTHIDNLVHAVEQAVLYQTLAFDVFNIADEKVYELREVILELSKLTKGKKLPILSISPSFLRLFIRLANYFHLNLPITEQALDYVTKPAVLNISKAKGSLRYREQYNFFEASENLKNWINQVSLKKVLEADKDLPWKL